VERDAKVEQLLLAGLDHYFAGQYDQAINIWTRALFVDRNHARARAYIERARRAQAERQRESEELLHNGAVAYRRGDGREARRLLQAALDAGAPFEDTFPMLERLNQLEAATPQPSEVRSARAFSPAASGGSLEADGHKWLSRAAVGAALLLLVGAGAYGVVSSREWSGWSSITGAQKLPPSPAAARDITLGVPTNGEMALASARSLASGGDLRGALTALGRVRPTDPQKPEADRLRADVQRQLIHNASEGPAPADAGQERRQ
jgi:tetratricopeptide (TPR) repeat protein